MFTNMQQKNDLISAAKTAKPDDLFVSENLTPTRQKIAYALRPAQRKFYSIFSGTNTMNGIPYVWIKPTGWAPGVPSSRHKIVSQATLIRFYNDTLGTPLYQVVNVFFLISFHACEPGTMLTVLLSDINVYV